MDAYFLFTPWILLLIFRNSEKKVTRRKGKFNWFRFVFSLFYQKSSIGLMRYLISKRFSFPWQECLGINCCCFNVKLLFNWIMFELVYCLSSMEELTHQMQLEPSVKMVFSFQKRLFWREWSSTFIKTIWLW